MQKERAGTECLNCGTVFVGQTNFCPKCGQKNDHQKISVATFATDLLKDTFSLDSRLGRTIIPFLFKPGYLSREFISGRRKKFVPPLRLYLFASFLFFLSQNDLFNINQAPKPDFNKKKGNIDKAISDFKSGFRAGVNGRDTGNQSIFKIEYDSTDFDTITSIKDGKKVKKMSRPDSLVMLFSKKDVKESDLEKLFRVDSVEYFKRHIIKKVVKFRHDSGSFKSYVNANLPTFFFLLLPVFALVLKLIYFRRKRNYIEHFIFVMHLQAFGFLLLGLSNFIGSAFNIELLAPTVGLTSVYSIIALKNNYGQSWIKTILKAFCYYLLGVIALSFCMLIFLATSIILF